MCFETGGVELSANWIRALQHFSIAVSFGSVESTVSLPCRMSHAAIPEGERKSFALAEDLIRISIGAEHGPDLLADVQEAMAVLGDQTRQEPSFKDNSTNGVCQSLPVKSPAEARN